MVNKEVTSNTTIDGVSCSIPLLFKDTSEQDLG